jgi:hypothetical protein
MILSTTAIPTAAAPPAKFAIQVTATLKGAPVSLYLKNGANGDGTANLAEAAACSLSGDELTCDGKLIGAQSPAGLPDSTLDMAPLAEATSPTAIADGFSVDSNMVLHFKSPKFDTLTEKVAIQTKQGGEAQFGLFDMSDAGPLAALMGASSAVRLYSQLGCPAGTHGGLHGELVVGKSKIVAL